MHPRNPTPFAAIACATALVAAPWCASGEGLELRSGVDVGVGWAGEDGFALLLLEQGLSYGGFELVLSGPLRFRVIDNSPEEDGVLREQDWDDPSDFARIGRRIAFEKEWEDGGIDVRLGELSGVGVGHGAAVDHYFNDTDMDHYHGGVFLDVGHRGNGLEFVLNDVVAPELLVGRARIAPLAWFLDGDWPRRFELGYTLGADIAAPRRVVATNDAIVAFTGGDLSIRLLDVDRAQLTPYVDVMAMDGDAGVHAGLSTVIVFSVEKDARLKARGEYRRLGSDYHPALLNPFTERSRRFYSRDQSTGRTNTFADHLANVRSADPAANGWMADLAFAWGRAFELGARFDSEGFDRPHWLLVQLTVAPHERFEIRAAYAGRDPDGAGETLTTDALVSIGTRIRIWKPFNAFAEFTRRYRRISDTAMPFANETGIGVGVYFVY